MGQKTHPNGFRLGVEVGSETIKDWQAKWFAPTGISYAEQVWQDLRIRKVIQKQYSDAGISGISIERSAHDLSVTVNTSRPGIVIGRGGQRVEELRKVVEAAAGGNRVRLNIQEIRQPELDAFLLARNIADQLERRVAFRRAIRQSVSRAMQAGAKGIKVLLSGRLGGAEIARREKVMEGQVPLHTLRADIDYGLSEAHTTMGLIGVKVWLYRGELLPTQAEEEIEEEELAPRELLVLAGEDDQNAATEAD